MIHEGNLLGWLVGRVEVVLILLSAFGGCKGSKPAHIIKYPVQTFHKRVISSLQFNQLGRILRDILRILYQQSLATKSCHDKREMCLPQ